MKIVTLDIVAICSGTSTNADALPLFIEMAKIFDQGDSVRLALGKNVALSSSFLNSSIGSLIDKYGIDFFKSHFSITNYKKMDAMLLKRYIDHFSSLAK